MFYCSLGDASGRVFHLPFNESIYIVTTSLMLSAFSGKYVFWKQ